MDKKNPSPLPLLGRGPGIEDADLNYRLPELDIATIQHLPDLNR